MDKPDYTHSVNAHYGSQDLGTAILEALRAAGKDPDNIHYTDLAGVDQFHSRGRAATLELAQLAGLHAGQSILDVGGGIGGPARVLAAEYGCHVTVLDLTEEYCKAGEMITRMTGLADRVTFQVGNALDMPFPDTHFDAAWTQHSSMNIPDKERLYAEIHRVLKPGGLLALHEIMAVSVQPLHFPAPWAGTPDISFLRPVQEMRALIGDAGFRETNWIDVTAPSLEFFRQRMANAASGQTTQPGIELLLRDRMNPAFKNLVRNFEEERAVVIMSTFERV